MSESNSDIYIESIDIVTAKYPLIKPYNLSFTILDHFISIQTEILFSNGKKYTAEVVPLLGYNDESEEVIVKNITNWIDQIIGLSAKKARLFVQENIKGFPFSTSPLLTAIDLLNFPILETNHDELEYVIPTSTAKVEELRKLLQQTTNTIKVKLSGNVTEDISGLSQVLEELKNYPLKLRFDANQAYNSIETGALCEFLIQNQLEAKVEYIEQPLPVGKENELGKLRTTFNSIHFMLDESIVSENDLDLAVENDIHFIKLKLFKQGGINETITIAKKAREIGIRVILGNGVATSVSNFIENQIYLQYQKLFEYPLESNGYKKIN